MNEQTIADVVAELAEALSGRALGKLFQLGRAALACDFRTGDGRYLFIAAEPHAPRLYLIARTVRELEKQSLSPAPFTLAVRKHLSGALLVGVSRDAGERVVRLLLAARDAVGREQERTLVAQLTGRSANLFLLDEAGRIMDAMRSTARGAGQEIGERYAPPAPAPKAVSSTEPEDSTEPDERAELQERAEPQDRAESEDRAEAATAQTAQMRRAANGTGTRARSAFINEASKSGGSISAALDEHYRRMEAARAFDARAAALRTRLRQDAEKRLKLRRNLERDLATHGDADTHKRLGDLLLANLTTAERAGARVRLVDYYADDAPTIEIEIDEQRTLQEEAAERFSRYTKARRAVAETSERLASLSRELSAVEAQRETLERIVEARDAEALARFEERERTDARPQKRGQGRATEPAKRGRGAEKAGQKKAEGANVARRYLSSDGYEILVGRGARDNDTLTFRVASAQDAWLHAADYPGSHVIVRNHQRGQEIPHRTIVEAAQLAAHFSHARKDAKVSVHYTQRKFVSKMKGAAPGLVRLSSFRTLLVEPRETLARLP